MPIRNKHFYNSNEAVAYPVDEEATCVADSATRLPPNVIVDMSLRYPASQGEKPFLSALAVTANTVTLTIEAADSMAAPSVFRPLAVLSVVKPVVEGRQYAVSAQTPGVGGWVVFGSGANDIDDLRLRFSAPAQSLLTARAARKYRQLPVSGMKAMAAANYLQGVVKLKADTPLEVVAAVREIAGVARTVAVLRLVEEDRSGGFTAARSDAADIANRTKTANVFRRFLGPCDKRPESSSCGNPEPIEFVSAVAPDCNGQITIDFRGCIVSYELEDPCTIVLDCDTSLDHTCVPPYIASADGKLPAELPKAAIPPFTPPAPTSDDGGDGESITVAGELPYTDCFDHGSATDFVVKSGVWTNVEDESPGEGDYCGVGSRDSDTSPLGSYASTDASIRAVSVWHGFDDLTLGRRVVADLKILSGAPGSKHNAGVVLNYRPHVSVPGRSVYYMAELDYDAQEFRISRFNGLTFTTVVSVLIPGLMIEEWYRIITTVVPGAHGKTAISARLIGFIDPVDVTLGPVLESSYAPSTGRNGFGTNKSQARFSFFRQEMVE